MASWTNQDPNSLLPGKPWTSAKALAAFENPTAYAEQASGAPINRAAWHPYDALTVGDGNDGEYYSGQSFTTIATPNFENGFEYRILGRGITFTSAVATTLQIDYLINGAWERMYNSVSVMTGPLDLDLWIRSPRRSARRFLLDYSIAAASTSSSWGPTNGTQENGVASIADNNAAVVTQVRFQFASRTFNGGNAFLLRRRDL
jgi:hypothetical protein